MWAVKDVFIVMLGCVDTESNEGKIDSYVGDSVRIVLRGGV